MLFTKPKGTFGNDNYTEYSMTTTWCGYNMNVGPYGYEEYEVDAGGGTASVYANGYGQWGTLYVDIPEDGYGGVEMYWNKSTKLKLHLMILMVELKVVVIK